MNVPRLTLVIGNLAQVKRAGEELYRAGFKKAGGYVWRKDDLVCWVVPAHAELNSLQDMKFGALFALSPVSKTGWMGQNVIGQSGMVYDELDFRVYLTQCIGRS